jgi:hydantoinase/carbamoylase family amidase
MASGDTFGQAIMAMADELAAFTETPGALTCTFLSPAHRAAAERLAGWMRAAGFTTEIDILGNVVGRYAGTTDRWLLTGSHYDTVQDGGRYDGRLGILATIAVVAGLAKRAQRLPFGVELVAFSDEEGVRFGSTFLGSSALAGRFDLNALALKDAAGQTMADALGNPSAADIARLRRDPANLVGYVELHIEQGPVLLDGGAPLGVVTAIAGTVRRLVTVSGVAGHAGTVPMALRRDAAAAAAEMVLAVERICTAMGDVVGTVGQLEVPQGSINVIPGRCRFSIDVRSGVDARRDAAISEIEQAFAAIAARRGVTVAAEEKLRSPAAACDDGMQARIARAITSIGVPAPRLPSGAGHDALVFAPLVPTGMMFVRCGNGGISHNPLETITAADADLAARAFLNFLLDFS